MKYPKDRPKIYEYDDFRFYIDQMCNYLLSHDSSLSSFREISVQAGFRSQSFLKMVISGERNLSAESIEKLITGLGLNKKEAKYFENMVNFQQAETAEDKVKFSMKIINAKIHSKAVDIAPKQLKYLSELHYVTIREMVELANFSEDIPAIAKSLYPRLTQSQVKKAIEDLIEMKFIKRNENGKLESTEAPVSTGDLHFWNKVQKQILDSFHKSMAKIAVNNFDIFDPTMRSYAGVTVPLDKSEYDEILEIMAKTRKEILSVVNRDPKKKRKGDVFRINLQMFPLSQIKKKKKDDKNE